MEEKQLKAYYEEDEIDLYELWLVLVKHKKLIFSLTFAFAFLSAVISLFMTNIYRSKVTISPVQAFSGSGALEQMIGISIPSGVSRREIMLLLKSDILKIDLIKKYNLLPILFYKRWDPEKKRWKEPSYLSKLKSKLFSFLKNNEKKSQDDFAPSIEDGIMVLNNIISVNQDRKLGIITISCDYPDPEMAKRLAEYVVDVLKEHLTREAIRIAEKNKKILEKELVEISDPIIQKLYELLIKHVETIIIMAKVDKDFAFKVIDPPMVPEKKYKPKRRLIVAVAFVSGLFLSIFLAFFLEYINNIKQRAAKSKNLEE